MRFNGVARRAGGRGPRLPETAGLDLGALHPDMAVAPARVTRVFISHLHGDHVAGLPPLLLRVLSDAPEAQVTVVGPQGVGDFVANSLRSSHASARGRVRIIELVHSLGALSLFSPQHWQQRRFPPAALGGASTTAAAAAPPPPLSGEDGPGGWRSILHWPSHARARAAPAAEAAAPPPPPVSPSQRGEGGGEACGMRPRGWPRPQRHVPYPIHDVGTIAPFLSAPEVGIPMKQVRHLFPDEQGIYHVFDVRGRSGADRGEVGQVPSYASRALSGRAGDCGSCAAEAHGSLLRLCLPRARPPGHSAAPVCEGGDETAPVRTSSHGTEVCMCIWVRVRVIICVCVCACACGARKGVRI